MWVLNFYREERVSTAKKKLRGDRRRERANISRQWLAHLSWPKEQTNARRKCWKAPQIDPTGLMPGQNGKLHSTVVESCLDAVTGGA